MKKLGYDCVIYSEQIVRAAEIAKEGGVIAYPTESCFGLGCNPRNIAAVKRILVLKKRSQEKGLILIADRFERLSSYLKPLTDQQLSSMQGSWPGPFTWICPAAASTSSWLTGKYDSLAVRVTNYPIAAALCRQAGMALVSTSANIASQNSLKDAKRVAAVFGDEVDYILDAPIGLDAVPSTITDVVTGQIIR